MTLKKISLLKLILLSSLCMQSTIHSMQWLRSNILTINNIVAFDSLIGSFENLKAMRSALETHDFQAVDKIIEKEGIQALNQTQMFYFGLAHHPPILHSAVTLCCMPTMIQHLIDKGAEVDGPDKDNLRAINYALHEFNKDPMRSKKIITCLVENNNAQLNFLIQNNISPLIQVMLHVNKPYNLTMSNYLIENGALINTSVFSEINNTRLLHCLTCIDAYLTKGIIIDQRKSLPNYFALALLCERPEDMRSVFCKHTMNDLNYYFARADRLKKDISAREIVFLAHSPAYKGPKFIFNEKAVRNKTAMIARFQCNLMDVAHNQQKSCDTYFT